MQDFFIGAANKLFIYFKASFPFLKLAEFYRLLSLPLCFCVNVLTLLVNCAELTGQEILSKVCIIRVADEV